jgi:ubiquinone/menaquinone biosynthesis C-methylase UbiE
MEKVDYDRRQYLTYQRGRALAPETVAGWMGAFAGQVGDRRPLVVLDLGSGTGRFSPALAETFGGPVYGVEPSVRMRELAERDAHHPDVTYLAGEAGRIPLPDGSCDVVLMFLSFHHVPDRAAAAREIARVLRPGGRVLLRSSFGDRLPDKAWLDYFPRAREVEQVMFPTLGETLEVFAAVGLRQVALVQVRERLAASLAAYVDRLRLRASSTFEHLTEAEIERGFAAIQAAADAETEPTPVEFDVDLLVLAADS